jgi:hypothetical protein
MYSTAHTHACDWTRNGDLAGRSDGSSFVMSALPNRQRAMAPGNIGNMMQELLQQLDLDYYRSALLLIARAELERLRQERSEVATPPEVAGAAPACGGAGAGAVRC